jgi:hypothetical protein
VVAVTEGESMPFESREKFVQRGSGQVFYVWQDDDSGRWVLGMFVGGPEGIQPIGRFDSKVDAEAHLVECDRMPIG